MPTYLKRNSFYTVVYTDKTGHRRWESTGSPDRTEAEEYYRNNIRFNDKRFVVRISYLSVELQNKLTRRLSVKTVAMYLTKLSLLIGVIKDKPIDKITSADIENFMSERFNAGTAITTINIDFRVLRSAFNRAMGMGLIKHNPCASVAPYRNPQRDPAVFSDEQVSTIINTEEHPVFKILWIMLYLTAGRRGEIINLEWTDIDFERMTIRIKNKDDHMLKTKKPRTIPLSSVVFDLLMNLPRCGLYIFCKEDGDRYSAEYVSKRFKNIIRILHFSEKYHLHSLRHSAATRMNELGESSFNIQQSLGHSSVTTTQLYIQSNPETLRGGYEKMARQFMQNSVTAIAPDQSSAQHGAASAAGDGYKSLSLVS